MFNRDQCHPCINIVQTMKGDKTFVKEKKNLTYGCVTIPKIFTIKFAISKESSRDLDKSLTGGDSSGLEKLLTEGDAQDLDTE